MSPIGKITLFLLFLLVIGIALIIISLAFNSIISCIGGFIFLLFFVIGVDRLVDDLS